MNYTMPSPAMMKQFFTFSQTTGEILWDQNAANAEVFDMFTGEPYVLFGVYCFKRDDLVYCLRHGEWPDGSRSHDPAIRREDFNKSSESMMISIKLTSRIEFEAMDAA